MHAIDRVHSGITAPLPGSQLSRDLAGACIFVVDDSATIRKTIARYLFHAGFRRIIEAGDGLEALALMECNPPDLVITDLLMPNTDGLELCRKIRSDPRMASVPILIQTGMATIEGRGDVFAHGATDLISKPLNLREMLGRVRVHVEQRLLVRQLSDYQQRILQDLSLARCMQESLLPSMADIEAIRRATPFDIASHYAASSGLGGDIWGLGMAGHGILDVYLADFTGHGVTAALNTFRFHAHHRNQALDCLPLSDALSEMNAFLVSALPVGQFATLIAARIDSLQGTVEICSAGGPPPIMRQGAEEGFEVLPVQGLPLGIQPETVYETRHFPFPPGSMLLLYSDAATETPPEPHAVFSSMGLAEFLQDRCREVGANDMITLVLDQLAGHVLEDDLTLVAIRHQETA